MLRWRGITYRWSGYVIKTKSKVAFIGQRINFALFTYI